MKTPSQNSSPEDSSPKTPIWETIVIAASFIGVWIYFFAWISAGRAKAPLDFWWQLLLVPCLVALVFVFRRRFARARDTVRENQQSHLRR